MAQIRLFKICPACGQKWQTRMEMLYDPNVAILGYQVHFLDSKQGLFYFNHTHPDCGTTFTLQVENFLDLYNGPGYSELMLGDEDCPLYCVRRTELRPCDQPCSVAFVREIMKWITEIHEEVLNARKTVSC